MWDISSALTIKRLFKNPLKDASFVAMIILPFITEYLRTTTDLPSTQTQITSSFPKE